MSIIETEFSLKSPKLTPVSRPARLLAVNSSPTITGVSVVVQAILMATREGSRLKIG